MYKELTQREVAAMLAENGSFDGYTRDSSEDDYNSYRIYGIDLSSTECSILTEGDAWKYCAIKIEPKLRLMTQQECIDWTCTIGSEYHQVKHKKDTWQCPQWFPYSQERIHEYRWRTIGIINGKYVYGKPQKFEVEE